jgi:alpha-tubulin suppressor-like RCC1 family protein
MKPKRWLVAGGAVGLVFIGYFLLRAPEGRLKLPAGQRAPMISLGDSHGLALAPDGSLWSWGGEDRGFPVLGLGNKNLTAHLVRIGSDTNWVFASAGDNHNLALKSDGTIWAWGANYRGQLGDGNAGIRLPNATPNRQNRPVHTVAGTDWMRVVAGSVTSYALKRDGSLWAWGLNNFGQLGIGSWTDRPKAVQVGTATNWVKIRAGGVSAAGLQADGSLWIWGGSPKLGNSRSLSVENLLVPTRFTLDTNWVDMSVAFNLWLAIKSDGTLWAWGQNAYIYTGASQDACQTPTQIGHDKDWEFVCSSRGGFYHLLKKRDGTFWVMDASQGHHTSVRLRKVNLPPHIVASAAGGGAIAAMTQDGEVWTCGTILGQHGLRDRFIRFVQAQCWRVGWQVRWESNPSRIVREQPWQLRNDDSKD